MEMQIRVDPRTVTGKHTKRLRAAGIVPGVVFGKKAGSVAVQLDAKALDQLYREAGRTSIVRVSVDGGETTSVVIKSIQRHPLTGRAQPLGVLAGHGAWVDADLQVHEGESDPRVTRPGMADDG